MKKILFGIVLGFVTSGAFYLFDSITTSRVEIETKTAFITINNKSDFKITNATLTHGNGELTVTNIPPNETAYFGFPNNSENDYVLNVKLENDTILQSIGEYFEYGLRAKETVTNTKITSEDNW